MNHKAMFLLVIVALAVSGCASRPPSEFGAEDTFVGEPISPTATIAARNEVLLHAMAQLGAPYVMGGMSPQTGFDCSGLVAYVFREARGLALPRNTFDLARTGASIADADLQPGDLVFYNTQRRTFSHVGIYLGDARFIHAPSSGGVVRIEDMRRSYWLRRFDGARRIAY